MTIRAKIFGTQDTEQTLLISYEYRTTGGLFSSRKYVVTRIELKQLITIAPSDLYEDLQAAIALDLGAEVSDVRIDCEAGEQEPVMMFI